MDDNDQIEDRTHRVHLALEYVDGSLNFYIKFFTNYDPLPSFARRFSRAVILVAIGLNRTTWMGRPRAPTTIELSSATKFKTLAVPRKNTTIFNEFFSIPVKNELFEKTMMRVQFCDVDKKDNEVSHIYSNKNEHKFQIVVGECDLWPYQYATTSFRELLIPQTLCRPDLGELELTIVYFPTAQRLCIDRVKGTNLKVDLNAKEVYVRFWLYTYGSFDEVHKTEHKPKQKDENTAYTYTKRIIFDLLQRDVMNAIVIVQAMELVDKEKRVIGQFAMSDSSPLCEQGQWRTAMKQPREQVTAIMRLAPGC